MPVTPHQAEAARRESNKAAIEAACLVIDTALMLGKRSVSMHDVPWSIRNELQQLYESAGWTIKYTDDQREGSYWTFSA